MRRFLLALLLMVGLTASMDAQVLGPVGHGNKLGNRNARGETHSLSSGFRGIVEAGVLGLDDDLVYSPSLQASFGYQFNPYFYSGLAAGLLTEDLGPHVYLAVDFRAHFINAVRTPFVALRTGIAIEEGPIFGLNIGYRFAINSANALNISLAADLVADYHVDSSFRICVGYEF